MYLISETLVLLVLAQGKKIFPYCTRLQDCPEALRILINILKASTAMMAAVNNKHMKSSKRQA